MWQTYRVFEVYCFLPQLFILGLRKKTVAPGAGGLEEHLKTPGHTDLFGQSDAIVKHVLEVKTWWFVRWLTLKVRGWSLTGLFQHYFPRAMIVVWTGLHFILQCHWLYLELMTDRSSSGEWMVLIIVLTFLFCILVLLCVIIRIHALCVSLPQMLLAFSRLLH